MDNGNKVNLFRMHYTIMIHHDEINYISYIKIEGGMPALFLDCNSLAMTQIIIDSNFCTCLRSIEINFRIQTTAPWARLYTVCDQLAQRFRAMLRGEIKSSL